MGAQQLRGQLPADVPSIITRNDRIWWDDGKGNAFEILAVANTVPLLGTIIGQLQVSRKLLEDNRTDALAALPRLLGAAKAAGLHAEGMLLSDSQLVGVHLGSVDAVVIPEGVLRKHALALDDRAADAARVALCAENVIALLGACPCNERARAATADILRRGAWADDHAVDVDTLTGAQARRLLRNGWLATTSVISTASQGVIDALLSAVNQAEHFSPILEFEGDDPGNPMHLSQVRNGLGAGGWVLSTPIRCVFARANPRPYYDRQLPEMNLTIELAPGSDPLTSLVQPVAAQLYQNGQRLAVWHQDHGFTTSLEAWRKVVPAKGRVERKAMLSSFLPPCIPVVGLLGDVSGLLVDGGYLMSPRSRSAEESARFLSQAAQLLPDAAHLDLLGEFMFTTVYGSPDSRFPTLIGNPTDQGGSNQTPEQTIGSACGGIMRGSADDLAELYQELAVRQGRAAHLVKTANQDICSWAEKREDGQWHIYVLQADAPLEFSDATLPQVLAKAYKAFGESDALDVDSLSIQLRFSGEAARATAHMSWRIFSEPEYARSMIDIQRDAYFHTYQRAIAKLTKVITDGDRDAVNIQELARVYARTGQHDQALLAYRKAIAMAPDSSARLYLGIEMVQEQLASGRIDEAKATANGLLTTDIPDASDAMGLSVIQVGNRLAAILSHRLNDLAIRTIRDTMRTQMLERIQRVGEWLGNPDQDPQAWATAPQFLELRRLTRDFSDVGIDVLLHAPQEALPLDSTLRDISKGVQDWLDHIAFHDVGGLGDIELRYAQAGRFYEAMMGQDLFTKMLEGAEPPKSAMYVHALRIGGVAQIKLDLPWIQISVPYWYIRISELFDQDRPPLHVKDVAIFGKHLEDAYQIASKLGIQDQQIDDAYHLGRLITALLERNPDLVQERLRVTHERNDRLLRDQTARWIGDAACYMPMDWFKQVIAIWMHDLGNESNYFAIAWRAALAGAPAHALYVAAQAADKYKDNPAIVEEFAFMTSLLKPLVEGSNEPK